MEKSQEVIYTVEEVAEMYKVSVLSVYIWLRKKLLIGFKAGRHWRVTQSAIDQFNKPKR